MLLAGALTAGGSTIPAAAADRHHGDRDDGFKQVNLVSDLASLKPVIVDPAVKNPWGIAFGPDTPLWVANQFNPASDCGPTCVPSPESLLTKVTLYQGANGKDAFVKVPLEVTASAPTGIVFNPTKAFVTSQGTAKPAPARFILNEAVTDAGGTAEITSWLNPSTGTTVLQASKPAAFYAGLALVPYSRSGPLLLAADFQNGTIDVYDGAFKATSAKDGTFTDPAATAPPYNVTYLDGRVYVAYAPHFGQPGEPGISVFSRDGKLLKHLITGAPLVGPWGMAIAPRHWGDFGGALLVGNVDDGKINAFNPRNGKFLGTLEDSNGVALVNPGLWGIEFGNGVIGTPNTLVFAAGVGEEAHVFGAEVYQHGLVGLIKPANDRGDDEHGDDEHGDDGHGDDGDS